MISPGHLSAATCRHLLRLALWIPLSLAAGYRPGAGWPEVSTPFYHATTPQQVDERIAHWQHQAGFIVAGYQDTGSMHPVLQGGRELLAMEACRPQTPLACGQLVQFNRGDHPCVIHYIAAISRDGRQIYLRGVNNRYSDGWFPREKVHFIVREIITQPAPDFTPSPRPGIPPLTERHPVVSVPPAPGHPAPRKRPTRSPARPGPGRTKPRNKSPRFPPGTRACSPKRA